MSRTPKKKLATWDIETDPFEAGQAIAPFAWDFFDGTNHTTDWNKFNETGCMQRFANHLENLTHDYIIYSHNGGKFDFLFLYKYFQTSRVFVIGSRIVSMKIGRHELRDSYTAVPIPLRKFLKGEIDYRKFRSSVRHQHYDEIIEYLHLDTEALFQLIEKFIEEFGHQKTMASAAIKELSKSHDFDICRKSEDQIYRKFYFGGRVEAFRKGVTRDQWKLYDVNSMYPDVMAHKLHPVKMQVKVTRTVSENTAFLVIDGKSTTKLGCFAARNHDRSISFPTDRGTFYTTRHEFDIAMKHKLFQLDRIRECHDFSEFGNFAEFVEKKFSQRMLARKNGDKARDIFYKLVPNSSYGKFAQDPTRFEDYQIVMPGDKLDGKVCQCAAKNGCSCDGWSIKVEYDGCFIWSRKSRAKPGVGYYNICIGASITGAARSVLLDALAQSDHAIYCDTDSITCRSASIPTGENLGQWKLEATGETMAIGGKKLYALLSSDRPPKPQNTADLQIWQAEMMRRNTRQGFAVKMASKGAQLTASEILKVANGGTVCYFNDAPSMRFVAAQHFIHRQIRLT